ncbi:2OG-Fe(II)-dependent halogenase WelO5 family protein [Nitrosopumilus sp. S4]
MDSKKIENIKPNARYLELLSSGEIPAIIIRNFYDKDSCNSITNRIKNSPLVDFNSDELKHVGSFLMEYITRKREYFEDTKKNQKLFESLLVNLNPIDEIQKMVKKLFHVNSVTLANDSDNNYSPCMIRVYKKGKKIPIHKDNIKYEGREYNISDIDSQLSCILHLQESEAGGNLVIYKKKWEKKNERFRNIDFDYSSEIVKTSQKCVISNLRAGDLVIFNPNYYHRVTKIKGETPRITLSMFLGLYYDKQRIVTWA